MERSLARAVSRAVGGRSLARSVGVARLGKLHLWRCAYVRRAPVRRLRGEHVRRVLLSVGLRIDGRPLCSALRTEDSAATFALHCSAPAAIILRTLTVPPKAESKEKQRTRTPRRPWSSATAAHADSLGSAAGRACWLSECTDGEDAARLVSCCVLRAARRRASIAREVAPGGYPAGCGLRTSVCGLMIQAPATP